MSDAEWVVVAVGASALLLVGFGWWAVRYLDARVSRVISMLTAEVGGVRGVLAGHISTVEHRFDTLASQADVEALRAVVADATTRTAKTAKAAPRRTAKPPPT